MSISYDVKKARVRPSERFQIKNKKDDFNIRVTIDDNSRKLFEKFEYQLTTLASPPLK